MRGNTSAVRLYAAARGQATTRQRRLLMVAACRVPAAEFYDPRIGSVLAAAERCADDPDAEAAAHASWDDVMVAVGSDGRFPVPGGEIAQAIAAAWELALDVLGQSSGGQFSRPRAKLAQAVLLSLRSYPGSVLTGGECDAVEACLRGVVAAGPPARGQADDRPSRVAVRSALAGLVRDILGNPARAVMLDPSLLTSTVVALATGIYSEQAFDRLPILADALQDAGCDNDELLDHLRDDGPHVRGCWALDLILGKT